MSSINSVQGFGSMQDMQGMEGMRRNATLTDEQKKQLQSILSKFDPNNLTTQDTQSIFEQFRDAGIRPGKDMENTIKAAGFDAEKLRSLGMQGMQRMEGRGQQAELSDDQKSQVQSILSKYDPNNLTAQDTQSIFKQIRDAGIQPGKSMIDTITAAGFDPEKLRSLGMPEMPGMQGGQGMQSMGGGRQQAELSDDQKSQIQSILSKYDPNNLTAQDAQSIFKQFRDAGIQPGKGMKETIEAAGFDSEKLRPQGMNRPDNQENLFWTSQNSTQGVNTSTLQSLQSILSQYDVTNLSTDQEKSLVSQLHSLTQLQSTDQENSFWTSKNGTEKLNTTALESLQSILGQYDFTKLSSDNEQSLFTQLQSSGLLQAGNLLNLEA